MSEIKRKPSIRELLNTLPQTGSVVWIGIRPGKGEPIQEVTTVEAVEGKGLEGDRFSGTIDSKRQVTLIQWEHLEVIRSFLHLADLEPAIFRRNIAVKGLNLLSLKEKQFKIGSATMEMTGVCHPCSWMEDAVGQGGYNAMRGHSGITAMVLSDGEIKVGDEVKAILE